MAESFFEYPRQEACAANRFLSKKFENGLTLVTADHGGWALLSPLEYDRLVTGRAQEDPNLYNLLKDKGMLLAESNSGQIVQDYKRRLCYLDAGVSLHIISPTLRCNHSCIYCHAKSKPIDAKGYDMDSETAKKVVNFIFQTTNNGLTIEFQGGEPLANFPVIQEIIESACKKSKTTKKSVNFTLVSNLTMMDEDILKYLISKDVRLCTSLDGPKEIHEKNRRYLDGRGSYNDVTRWIDVIKNQYGYNVNALPTITRHSLPYAEDIVDAYRENGFERIRARHMINAGFAQLRWSEIGYSGGEFIEFWKELVDYCISLNKKGIRMVEGLATLIARKFLSKDHQSYTCLGSPCGAALGQAAYTPDGGIYACDESRSHDIFRLGNVYESTYKEIYTGRQALTLVDLTSGLSSHCDACVWHPYCGNCLISTYGEQGSLVSKLPLDRECRIRQGMVEYTFRKLALDKSSQGCLIKWATTDTMST